MFIVSTPGTFNLVFIDRNDLENTFNHLQAYVNDKSDPDNAIRVYSVSSTEYPVEKLTEMGFFLKERFTHD